MENPLKLTFIDPQFSFCSWFWNQVELSTSLLLLLLLCDKCRARITCWKCWKFWVHTRLDLPSLPFKPKYALFNCDFSFIKVSIYCMILPVTVIIRSSKRQWNEVFSISIVSPNEINTKSKQSQIWRTYVMVLYLLQRPVTHNVNLLATNVHFVFSVSVSLEFSVCWMPPQTKKKKKRWPLPKTTIILLIKFRTIVTVSMGIQTSHSSKSFNKSGFGKYHQNK